MKAVPPPAAARARPRHAGGGNPAAGGSLALAVASLLLPCLPVRTEDAHAAVVIAGLVGSFTAAVLGWAALRSARRPGAPRRAAAVAGTAAGVVGVCLLLLQLPGVVLGLLTG